MTSRDPLRDVLEEALALDAPGRRAFLDALARRDPELARRIERLVELEARAGDYFEELGERVGRSLGDELDEAARDPDAIGRYCVVGRLGRGGMGAVYEARAVDVEDAPAVAVKLARFELSTGEELRRFRAERQFLARLQHPGIARLLDGGVTDDGRPYTVMELVRGVPVTSFAEARGLGVEARLALLLSAADAVAHAHRSLVVHCDLKPDNLLVAEDGTVKLLDFGIAKLLAEEEPGAPRTLTGIRPMTPAYAAPEQVRGEPVTTATDVYGLGLVLYELLTGRRPFGATTSRPELSRAILETSPERPSRAAARAGLAWSARLGGDLDTICMKALRKEPEQRYPSADRLADDLRRHLAGLPVRARPDRLGYRAGKFVARHRAGVAVTALFALLVLGFGVVTAERAARYARERDRAERAVELLVDVLEASDPTEARGETVTARELLEAAARSIEQRFGDEPEVQAALRELVGRAFWNLGLRARARELLDPPGAAGRAR